MIDNDIEIKEEEAFDLEDMEPEEDKANASASGYGQQQKVNLLEDEWDIEWRKRLAACYQDQLKFMMN